MIFVFLHLWFLEIVAVSSPEHDFWKSSKNDAIKKSSFLLIFKIDDTPNEILTFLTFRWLAWMVAMPFFWLRRSRCVGVFWRAVLEMTVFVTFAAFSFGNKKCVFRVCKNWQWFVCILGQCAWRHKFYCRFAHTDSRGCWIFGIHEIGPDAHVRAFLPFAHEQVIFRRVSVTKPLAARALTCLQQRPGSRFTSCMPLD